MADFAIDSDVLIWHLRGRLLFSTPARPCPWINRLPIVRETLCVGTESRVSPLRFRTP